MSVSNNNEDLRAALNRRLAKRATHRTPSNRPTVVDETKPPIPHSSGNQDRRPSSCRRDVGSAASRSQRSPSPGLRWFTRSRAKEDTKAQEEEEEKEQRLPADSAATTRASQPCEEKVSVGAARSGIVKSVDKDEAKASIGGVHMEGYLSKLSSGTVKRWQKRYFILDGEYLGYLSAPGPADLAKKTFDLSKASNVEKAVSEDPNSADFNLIYNENVYYMRAPSVAEMRKWMNSMQIVIAATYGGSRQAGTEPSDVDRMSDSAPSLEGSSVGGGRMNSTASPTRNPTRVPSTIWETDFERLDRMFEDCWFDVVNELKEEKCDKEEMALSTSKMIDGVTKCSTDLYATLAGQQQQQDGVGGSNNKYVVLKYEDTHTAIEERVKDSPEEKDKCMCIVQEYMQRLALWLGKWLDERAQWKMHDSFGDMSNKGKGPVKASLVWRLVIKKIYAHYGNSGNFHFFRHFFTGISEKFSELSWGKRTYIFPTVLKCVKVVFVFQPMAAAVLSSDFPALLEAVARLRAEIDKIFGLNRTLQEGGGKNGTRDSVSLRTRKKGETSEQNGPYLAWRQQLEAVLQRLGSELETAVIEDIDKQLQTTNVWEPKCQNSLGEGVHGPKLLLEHGQYCLTTSWTPHLLRAIKSTLDVQATTVRSHPYSATIITEHTISGIVAVINCAWRLMKNRVSRTTSAINHKKGLKGKATAALGKAKRSGQKHSSSGTASVAPSGSSAVTNDDSPGQLQRSGSSKSSSIPPLEFMIAFSNEAGSVAGFCASTADDLNSRRTPETQVYGACMAGQATAFSNLAQETGQHIAEVYFKPKYKSVISKAFNKDRLLVRVETPMTESVRNAGAFAQQLKEEGASEATNAYTVRGVLDVIVSGYIRSLCENKPKLDRFPKLPDVMAADEALVVDYFTNHKVGALERTDVNKCIEINATIRSFLTDNDINLLMVHYLEVTRLVGASKAKKIAKAVVSMRSAEWNKKQRSDILKQLTKNQGGLTMSSDESP